MGTAPRGGRGQRGALLPLAAVLVVLLIAAAAGGAWWWTHRDQPVDPQTVDIPAPVKADASAEYMKGPGKPLTAFLDATDDVAVDATKSECTALVETLKSGKSPQQLAAIAQKVPDSTLRDAFQNHVRNVAIYLGACGTGKDLSGPADDAKFSAVVARRQLKTVGGS